ncbi:52K protein [Amniota adenovirus 1]|nr:52K protein [Amniota adenovirus 1]
MSLWTIGSVPVRLRISFIRSENMHPAIKAVSEFSPVDCRDFGNDSSYGLVADASSESFKARKQSRIESIPHSAPEPKNVFADDVGRKPDETRDLEYKSGLAMRVDTNRVLKEEDFKPDINGSNAAMRRMEACDIKRNAVHTKDAEMWLHDQFMESCKQLLSRPSVELGIVYLGDFIRNYVDRPPNHQLAVQMVLLQQHADPCLKRILDSIKPPSEGSSNNASEWFVDLVGVLEMVVEEERTAESRASAACVIVNKLSLYFAKKASGGSYPTADKLSKTNIYFKRVIISCLKLADRIGCYDRDITARPKRVSRSRRILEPTDAEYLFNLESALEGSESDEDSDEGFM